jgi:adenine/guanine phosphoribosyltransferase-like PRPP-binding protein
MARSQSKALHDELVVVDDWAETGSQALTARRLIERWGGRYVGLSRLVDQLEPDVRATLEPVSAAALAEEVRG